MRRKRTSLRNFSRHYFCFKLYKYKLFLHIVTLGIQSHRRLCQLKRFQDSLHNKMSGLFILCLCACVVMSSAIINPYSYGYGGYTGGMMKGGMYGGGMMGGIIPGRMRYRRSIGMPIYGYPTYGTYGGYKGSYYY
ncbi:uncharacterized protein LOC121388928 [Gigantopelta aegis]|uniref:uncharacterized protein LOC121388928 n=1 Tax=Gigantopelta aegis TaxID=1735272 RepID=UPI001B88BD2C|nr:uncharacterized protein LOC121388928 [Gigantopelta aegis]